MTNLKEIKELHITARRWLQKSAGNTYHSVQVYVNDEELTNNFAYGYEKAYLQTAIELLQKNGYDVKNLRDLHKVKDFSHSVADVKRKKDLKFWTLEELTRNF